MIDQVCRSDETSHSNLISSSTGSVLYVAIMLPEACSNSMVTGDGSG
jgi:hypothetical protein